MGKNVKLQFLLVVGVGALIGYAAACGKLNPFQKADAAPAKSGAPGDKDREADCDEVRTAVKVFVQTFEKGDASALASLWTEEGEYVADDGTTLHGRAALKDGYTQFFKKNPDSKLEVTIESVRFISHDSAVVEGAARTHKGAKVGEPTSSRISALYAHENGKWLLALLREWPDNGAALRDVDWLIGSWEAKSDNADVRTTYEWDEGRTFIRARFTIKNNDKDVTLSGTQLIGKDPRTGLLHSWLFESDGGFGEAVWNWDGKHWRLDAAGVEADGGETAATNLLTPLGKDSFTWQSIDRKAGDESLPDIAPVKVTRVK
jgi:uncharacterized protein (TIGR02246 family)